MYSYKKLGITRKFSVVNQKLRHMFDRAFAHTGVTAKQASVLHFVYTQNKNSNIYQKDIETEFDIRSSSATSMLHSLERQSFIIRESDKNDFRLKKLVLTNKGIEMVEPLQQNIDLINHEILKGFSEQEIDLLNDFLERISDNLDTQEELLCTMNMKK